MKPLRILIVVEPGIDGVFRHVEGLVHYLWSQGQEIHLAYSDRRGSPALAVLVQQVRERNGQTLNLSVGNAPEPADAGAVWRLRDLAARIRPDVIHAHSSKAGVLARSLARLGISARYFYTPHAYYGLCPRPEKLRTAFYNWLEKIFATVGTTIAISADEASFANRQLGIPKSRIRTIHNPVNADNFTPVADSSQIRKGFGLPENQRVLGFIGRLSFQKDPQTLYRALAQVFASQPDLMLFQIGHGDLETELQALAVELGIQDRIICRRYLDEPANFYRAIDALAVTSRYEAGWPIVVLEALAADRPVIVCDAPGTSDISAGGLSHCWTAPAGDVSAVARAISAWLADVPAKRPVNHREKVIERFGIERCYGAVLQEYRTP